MTVVSEQERFGFPASVRKRPVEIEGLSIPLEGSKDDPFTIGTPPWAYVGILGGQTSTRTSLEVQNPNVPGCPDGKSYRQPPAIGRD